MFCGVGVVQQYTEAQAGRRGLKMQKSADCGTTTTNYLVADTLSPFLRTRASIGMKMTELLFYFFGRNDLIMGE